MQPQKKKSNVKLGLIWKDIFKAYKLLKPFFAFLRHHVEHYIISINSAVTCGLTECKMCAEGEARAVMREMSYKSWLKKVAPFQPISLNAVEISSVCANAEREKAMRNVKGGDGNSFMGEIFNWNDEDKICYDLKGGGQSFMKRFI